MRSTDPKMLPEQRDTRLEGIGASTGAAVGRVLRIDYRDIAAGLPADFITDAPVQEIDRLHAAVEIAREQILAIKERVAGELGRGHAYFFEAHLLMLEDRELLQDVERIIRTRRVKAEWAVKSVLDRMLIVYSQVKDDYLRERGSDIEDVARRVIRALSGGQGASLTNLNRDVVIVADTLPPSTVAELDLSHILGFATGDGGYTSHTAIIARSLGIPAVVGLKDIAKRVSSGETIAVDGAEGTIYLNPSKPIIRRFLRLQKHQRRTELEVDGPIRPVTLDGHECTIRANVELTSEFEAVRRFGARGVGLYRSEFLYLNRMPALPTEDEQVKVFEQALEAAGEDGVTIRTFDLGGDKLSLSEYESDRNPTLGLRALRLALKAEDVFRTHLRAILRASAKGKLRIVFPMVSGLGELRAARALLDSCKRELRAEGRRYDSKVPVGVMIEVPSAVVVADQLAAECDFFSIGTNDLIQYMLAVDRSNQSVADIYEPLHPAVLRSLKSVAEVATRAGIPAIVCGEMSSNPVNVVVLVGLGFDRFSMTPSAIPLVSRAICAVDRAEACALAESLMTLATSAEIDELLATELPRRFPRFFES